MWKSAILLCLVSFTAGIPVRNDKFENSLFGKDVTKQDLLSYDYSSEETQQQSTERPTVHKSDHHSLASTKNRDSEDLNSEDEVETSSREDYENDSEDYENHKDEREKNGKERSREDWLVDDDNVWDEEDDEWVANYEDEVDLFLDDMDDFILDLMDNNEYDGIAIGIAQAGKLIFADGYGDWGEKQLHATAVMPISSISRTITAVAVLQLIEQGHLSLDSQVFGKDGVLDSLEPVDGVLGDARINDITVEHLLRHTAGWDHSKAPVYDPLLNQLYLQRGGNQVVDIAKTLKVGGRLTQYDIIQFMLSIPLDYEPGKKSKQSNFGYSILGRVVEEISLLPYEEYVKKFILTPAGMIHTRVGPRYSDEYMLANQPGMFRTEINSNTIHSLINPMLLDSALGWYSNVFDLSRFMSSLIGYAPRKLLSTPMVELMFKKPAHLGSGNQESWRGIGFHVKHDGTFWMDSDIHDNDVIMYHKGPWGIPVHANPSETLKDGVTVFMLTTDNQLKKLKSAMIRIVDMVDEWPANMPDVSIEEELADLEIGKRIVRYQLAENHLKAYINALRSAAYVPTWIHGYMDGSRTQFAIVADKQMNAQDLDYELLVEVSKKKLFSHIAQLQAKGYYVSFLQSYESWAHDDQATHLALLTQATHRLEPEKWAIADDIDVYFSELGTASSRGYTLEAQSVIAMRKGPRVTYLMKKLDDPAQGRFMSFHDLTLQQLEDKTRENAGRNYTLSYLDTYTMNDKAHFSAIYRQHSNTDKWILQTDITLDDFVSQGEYWQDVGYLPKIVIGYEDKKGLRFATFWTKPN